MRLALPYFAEGAILGQPYAFRQAGLAMGIILLVSLTITVCALGLKSSSPQQHHLSSPQQVDWTIRLIVINSKLSGANSFQATMEHCFGKSGLIAISVSMSNPVTAVNTDLED